MKAIKTLGKYSLYRIDGSLELWSGKYGSEYGYRAGYVSCVENFEYAIEVAKEEMASLMSAEY